MSKPNKFSGMMNEFCVGQGYCGSVVRGKHMHVSDFIPDSGQITAAQFVDWLILAEGMNEYSVDHKKLRQIFIKHMGAKSVDAHKLR